MYSWSKLAKLHRAKERKNTILSNQPGVCPFPLKVVWSGISLIKTIKYCRKPSIAQWVRHYIWTGKAILRYDVASNRTPD